jgi:hypothetical protein
MSLHLPLSVAALGSLSQASPYDFSSPDPHQWRLGLGLETATAASLQAVCTGELSAVPPNDLPSKNVAPLRPPQSLPPAIDLYLRPLFFPASQLRSVNAALQTAGLGERLRAFVYRNVDPSSLGPSVGAALAAFQPLKDDVDQEDRLKLFVQGEFAISVVKGDVLAQVAAQGSPQGESSFAVWTTSGFVDPVAFFTALQNLLDDPTQLPVFALQFGSHWPDSLLDTAANTKAACQTRLFPYPALAEARLRLTLSATDWAAVGVGQKAIYWQQLLARAGQPIAAPLFVFNREDMANPFQLEAVSDFFLNWPQPMTPGSPPPLAVPPPVLILASPGLHLVVVDPFDLLLTTPSTLPGPAFHLALYAPQGLPCALGALIAEDTYRGLLFVVHDGEIVGWFRWSTYSSHQWEDRARVRTDDDGDPLLLGFPIGPLCAWAASIQGNARYNYRAEPAEKSSFINFGFLVWDPSLPGESASCRFYFRPGSPPVFDQDRRIMIHNGLSADTDPKNAAWSYNGSASGLVSPELYKLRNLMIERHLLDYERSHGTPDPAVLPLRNADATLSVSLFKNDDDKYKRATWKGALSGFCWVIRPNEPEGP